MPLVDALVTMVGFFLLLAWIVLVIMILIDAIFSDIAGWEKALWVLLVIVLPFVGVLIYLIVHGGDMERRARGKYSSILGD